MTASMMRLKLLIVLALCILKAHLGSSNQGQQQIIQLIKTTTPAPEVTPSSATPQVVKEETLPLSQAVLPKIESNATIAPPEEVTTAQVVEEKTTPLPQVEAQKNETTPQPEEVSTTPLKDEVTTPVNEEVETTTQKIEESETTQSTEESTLENEDDEEVENPGDEEEVITSSQAPAEEVTTTQPQTEPIVSSVSPIEQVPISSTELPPITTESPSVVKNMIGRGSFHSARKQFSRPQMPSYNIIDDSEDFEPYHDKEFHPIVASIDNQVSNEEVTRMMNESAKEDLLLEEADEIPQTTPSEVEVSEDITEVPTGDTAATTTTTTPIEVEPDGEMFPSSDNVVVDEPPVGSLIGETVSSIFDDPTIFIYTLFCIFCVSLVKVFRWSLEPKTIELPQKKMEPPAPTPGGEVLGSKKHLEIREKLEKEIKMLKARNLRLTKSIERQPIKKGRKEVAEKLVQARSRLAVLKQFNSINQKSLDLKKQIVLAKYNQILMIQNFVPLKDLLDLIKVIEFKNTSDSLKESAFAMKVECDFLREQIGLYRSLAQRFKDEYQNLSVDLALEKKKEAAIEEEFTTLRNLCDELDLNNSIDDWKRKIADKELETDRYYKDYINNYFRFMFQSVEVT